ncbi:amastigote surface protein-2 [Trypanosoma cruzi]|nr:amastigote surface protein-2 [Trypanosoma cruzi]
MWVELPGAIAGVWANSQSDLWEKELACGSLCHFDRWRKERHAVGSEVSSPWWESEAHALYVWVTDSNRVFCVGPAYMDAALNKSIANALLCSDGALYLVGARDNGEKSSLFPASPDGGAADDHFHPP